MKGGDNLHSFLGDTNHTMVEHPIAQICSARPTSGQLIFSDVDPVLFLLPRQPKHIALTLCACNNSPFKLFSPRAFLSTFTPLRAVRCSRNE